MTTANMSMVAEYIRYGLIKQVDLGLITCFINMSKDDLIKIIKFKDADWDKYNEYSHQDIISNLEQNELFDRMMKNDEDSDEDTD